MAAGGRHQFGHALFLRGQFGGVDFGTGGHAVHVAADFAQLGFDTIQHCQAFGKTRFDAGETFQLASAAPGQAVQAVVAVDVGGHFFGSLQQFGSVRQAVVALRKLRPFPFHRGEFFHFAHLPGQPFALFGQTFALGLGHSQILLRLPPLPISGLHLLGQWFAAGKSIQQIALHGFAVERVVRALAVDVHQAAADLAQLGQGSGLIIDEAAAAAFAVDGAADGKLDLVCAEQALFAEFGAQCGQAAQIKQGGKLRFRAAVADLAVVGLVAEQQAERIERDGFAGAGFASKHGKAGLEIQMELLNNHKIAQREGKQHGVLERKE